MTLEEAKKILEKEGFKLGGPGKPGVVSEAFAEYEAPEICEAMQIVCSAGFQLAMLAGVFDERKERLKKEYEKNTKAPDSAKNCIKEDSVVINPALKESASQFNDALLDEQAKKIAELTKEKSNLEDQIMVLNACKKHNDKIDRKQIKSLGKEIAKLNGIIHDKNAILSDVAEELRLTKIREKNLVEVSQKYMKENEELKKELADKVVDKIDAQALKSAESALAWKEKVIAEKDEVIADLTHELKAKHKKYVWYKGAYDAAQQILNTIADYAAKHPDKKFSDQMIEENHPAIDIAEEDKDHSGKIVLCGKDFVKKYKENKDYFYDLLKKRDKEIADYMFIESGHLGGNGVFDQMEVVKPSQRFKSAVCDARLELLYFMS